MNQFQLNRQTTSPIPLVLQTISTLRILDFEAPELDDRPLATPALFCQMGQTHDPSGTLAILKLLSISPLLHEFVRSIEVGGEGPFTEP